MALAGTVFAYWEFVSVCASATLYGGIYGQSWSPYDGALYGHAYNIGGGREIDCFYTSHILVLGEQPTPIVSEKR